ncbi:uncharacterized protein LOC129788787 [Lutzomyia longipalpis]|uniref:uncharacterized protein LOC129788787 n=1 Tax=Lutzomyia longipalpis TaxID=7200 RepID=UPI0024841C65|nr:uncharacterized protein LOC129788787 [Lutzomyia longipalpis]
MVKTVQGLGNHTVGCAVGKLSHVLGKVVQNTTALAGITGKVFTGVTDHFEACVKNNSHKSIPQAACLTSFIGTTTNKTAMITEHLADTAGKLVDSIIGTGNITDCLQKTIGNVKETVIDFATCLLSNSSKSARSMRFPPYPLITALAGLDTIREDDSRILVGRPTTTSRHPQKPRASKEMKYEIPEEILRSLLGEPSDDIDFNIDAFFDVPEDTDDWDIFF